ncbi:MAG: efflux RND transporter periplasmic adaptor subunit [Candidatus Omnitrophota bacterium]
MIKHTKLILSLVISILVISSIVLLKKPARDPHEGHTEENKTADVYWTCSMHPQVKQDKPGQCPICAMNLIPISTSDQGKVIVDEEKREYLDIRSASAEKRPMIKRLRLAGRIGHDSELYTLQQEYLSAISFVDSLNDGLRDRQQGLVESAKLRLRLLGLGDDQIKELEARNEPDKSLIDPTLNKIWAQVDIYEQDIRLIKIGQNVTIKVKGYKNDFSGIIYSINNVLNEQTRSATARIQLNNTDRPLKHQVYADFTLELSLGERLNVPADSVIDTGTRKVVYVDEGNGRYQFREVIPGVEADGFIEIKEGLRKGEQVVTNGNFFLDSQTTLTGGQSLLFSGSEKVDDPSAQTGHRH